MSALHFKISYSIFLANFDVSRTPAAFSKFCFVAQLEKSSSTFSLSPKDFVSGKYLLNYIMYFLSIQLLEEQSQPVRLRYILSPFLFITLSTLNSFWFIF